MALFVNASSLCTGYLGASTSSSDQAYSGVLDGALVALEGAGSQTGDLLLKAEDALTCLHGSVFPKNQPPASLGELAELFGPDASPSGTSGVSIRYVAHRPLSSCCWGTPSKKTSTKPCRGFPANRTAKCCRLAISLLGPTSLRRS